MMENAITDELEKITRRLDGIEKRLDIQIADREILESIQGRLTALEEQWKLTRQHNHAENKDIKTEIGISNDRVIASIETHTEKVEDIVEKKLDVKPKKRWSLFKR